MAVAAVVVGFVPILMDVVTNAVAATRVSTVGGSSYVKH